jgi:hypothetical protein
MLEDEDMHVLARMKRFKAKKQKTFSKVINSSNLSSDELDDLFLSE